MKGICYGSKIEKNISVQVTVEDTSNTDEECAPAPFVLGISSDKILLNPNVFTDFKMAGDQEVNLHN